MPQTTRTPTQRRGRRYSHDLTRNLIRTGCRETTLSPGAGIETPPVTCDALATPVTCISMLARPRSPGRTGAEGEYDRRRRGRAGTMASRRDGAVAVHRAFALPCSSIRTEVTHREHAPDRLFSRRAEASPQRAGG